MTKKIIITIVVLIFISLAILSQIGERKQGKEKFIVFNEADIAGVIRTKVRASVSGTKFQVDGRTFVFHPLTSNLNNSQIFSYVAEKGDSIIKPSYADTLTLICRKGRLKYTFSKLDD